MSGPVLGGTVPSRLALVLRLALRDLRGSGRSFAVLLAALTLGVAIIAAVGILNRGVATALERDARALLGGDIELEQANAPIPSQDLGRILPAGAALSAIVRTNSLVTAQGRSLSVSVKAVDAAYPLLGQVVLDPPQPLAAALADHGAVVERALLVRLGVGIGDRLSLGETEVRISAVLVREPDSVGGLMGLGLGPRLLVSRATLDAAQVLLPGALARYAYRLALPTGLEAGALIADLRTRFPEAGWQARGQRDVQPQVTRVTDRLATFLTLAGLTALLTGGVGMALTVETHLGRRAATIATLKALGATGGQIFALYLVQILLLAVLGTAFGLLLGLALPMAVLLLPAGLLPVTPDPGLAPMPLLLAAAAGLATTLLFALWPLAVAREVTPAALFRALVAPQRRWPRRPYLAALAGLALLLALIAVAGVPQPALGGWFVLTVLAAVLLLGLLTRAVVLLARRLGQRGGFALRLALASLHRPGSSAPRVIMALGAGVTLLVAVAVLAANLRAEIAQRLPAHAPALFLIDIQPQQQATLRELLEATPGARLDQLLPSLRAFARSLAHNAAQADDLVQDTLVKALANVDRFEPGTNLRAWLFTILRNHYYSQLRKLKREVEDADGKFAARIAVRPEQDGSVDLEDFKAAFAQLAPDHREVLTLVGASGCSYEEAAAICGCAVGTIKSRVNRARRKLSDLLGLDDDGRPFSGGGHMVEDTASV